MSHWYVMKRFLMSSQESQKCIIKTQVKTWKWFKWEVLEKCPQIPMCISFIMGGTAPRSMMVSFDCHFLVKNWLLTWKLSDFSCIKGKWWHWDHEYIPPWDKNDHKVYPTGHHRPPLDIGANFYPSLGAYRWTNKVYPKLMQRQSPSTNLHHPAHEIQWC